MNMNKANLVLGVAAIVLAVPTWLTLAAESTLYVDIATVPRMFEGLTKDRVQSVAIGEPKKEQPVLAPGADPNQKPPLQYDTVTFQRSDKAFVLGQGMGELTGAPVNAEMLELHVWKHLADIRADKETLVQPEATDAQLQAHGLDLEHAFVVKAVDAQNQAIAELLVGKDTAPAPASGTDAVKGVFVRRADSRDIVLYEVPFWQRQLKPEIWLDRNLLKLPQDTVRSLAVKNQTGEVVWKRPKGTTAWTCEQPPEGRAAVRQIEVDGLVQRMGYLQASSFVRPLQAANLPSLGLEPALPQVTIVHEKDGQEQTVVVGFGQLIDGKNEIYLRTSESAFVMTVTPHLATPFERAVAEFFDPAAPPPIDPPKDGGGEVKKPEVPKEEGKQEERKNG